MFAEGIDDGQMRMKSSVPNRIQLIAHANPVTKDVGRFGFADTKAYLRFIRESLASPLRLTCSRKLLKVVEDEQRGSQGQRPEEDNG